MVSGSRKVGPGRLTLDGMMSLEPLTIGRLVWAGDAGGTRAYSYSPTGEQKPFGGSPQLFQTGESYLGAPFFASDYVAGVDGKLRLSSGSSGLISYEHLWTPNFKTTATLSAYSLHSSSDKSLIGGVPFDFDYKVRGWQAQVGAEYMPISNLSFGSEVSFSRDRASGSYSSVAATPIKVGVWGMYFYIRRRI